MKKLTLLLSVALATSAYADFTWNTSTPLLGPDDPTDRFEADFNTALPGGPGAFDPLNGYLVQLIEVVGTKDAVDLTITNGGTIDDVIFQNSFAGGGTGLAGTWGSTASASGDGTAANRYYIRVWGGLNTQGGFNAFIQGDPAAATIQLPNLYDDGGIQHIWVGETAVFDGPSGNPIGGPNVAVLNSGATNFDENLTWSNISLIPEPATFAMVGMGILGILYSRIRRKGLSNV